MLKNIVTISKMQYFRLYADKSVSSVVISRALHDWRYATNKRELLTI